MPDPAVSRSIVTLPLLRPGAVIRQAEELLARRTTYPVSLLLPCHARELGTPALERIIGELASSAPWLEQIVVGLDGADEPAFRAAAGIFAALPQRTSLLWNDGPAVSHVYETLTALGHPADVPGKGRNVWTCLAWLFACGTRGAAASHDCDIENYSTEMLVRLCWPVGQEGITFSKGYCARFSGQLHGRVERLLFRPLAEAALAAAGAAGSRDFGSFRRLGSLRYALAGETAVDIAAASDSIRVPPGWGLEAALACAAASGTVGVAQAEIGSNYEHRHHELSAGDASAGLHRMAIEVAAVFLEEAGRLGGPEMVRQIAADFPGAARAALSAGRRVASANDLAFPESAENEAVNLFSEIVARTAADPRPVPRLPPPASLPQELPQELLAALCAAAVRVQPG